MNLSDKYILKPQYRLGFIQNKNYIIGGINYQCVFLNPLSAVLINNLVNTNSVDNTIDEMVILLKKDRKVIEPLVINTILRLKKYLIVDHDRNKKYISRNELLKQNIAIIQKSKQLISPFPKKDVPHKIKFYLTDYCSRQCIYCFAGAKNVKNVVNKNQFLSIDRFREIIIEADKIGVKNIEISGGDPFILDNICDYLQIMINHYHNSWATSTKTYISYEKAKQLAEIGLKDIQVSIDSFDEKNGDKIMGSKNSTNEVIETIKNLLSNNINVSTRAVITSINIRDIPFLIEKEISLGVKEIRFTYYYLSGNKKANYLISSKEDRLWLDGKIRPLIDKAKKNNILLEYSFYNEDDDNDLDSRPFCGGFTESMSVRYDGGVIFCDSLNHLDEFVAGNLKEQSIMEVWNSDRLKKFSDPDYFKDRYIGTRCANCNIFDNCFYKRCYVRSYSEYGNYFDMDPACPFGPKDYRLIK